MNALWMKKGFRATNETRAGHGLPTADELEQIIAFFSPLLLWHLKCCRFSLNGLFLPLKLNSQQHKYSIRGMTYFFRKC